MSPFPPNTSQLMVRSLCSSFSRLLRALHPSISPPTHRLGVSYHQPKKHRSDAKYTIAPREFLSTFNSVYPSFRKGESQEDAMEFFSKVRERLHDELLADLELELRKSGNEIETNEQWIMEKSPISDIFRGYYITKVPTLNTLPFLVDLMLTFSDCVQSVIQQGMPPWKKPGNSPLQSPVH